MVFHVSLQRDMEIDPPVAPSFDQVRRLGDLAVAHPAQRIGFVDPSHVKCGFFGERVTRGTVCTEGLDIPDDDFAAFRPIIETGLSYVFAAASDLVGARCTLMAERVIVPPHECARPHYASIKTHIDDLSRWFFEKSEHAPHKWQSYVMWSSDLAAEFYLSGIDVSGCHSQDILDQRIASVPHSPVQTFPPGSVTLHTGAVPHSSVLNMTGNTITRTWFLMSFSQ